jgi:hypothetical protein
VRIIKEISRAPDLHWIAERRRATRTHVDTGWRRAAIGAALIGVGARLLPILPVGYRTFYQHPSARPIGFVAMRLACGVRPWTTHNDRILGFTPERE